MKTKKIHTLFLAAHASELAPLTRLGRKYSLIRGDTAYLAAGVGPVAAAFGLTHFLEDYRPERIIAVGTAGVINVKKFKIGDVVVAKSVATASGLTAVYTPKLQPHRIVLAVGAGSKPARNRLRTTHISGQLSQIADGRVWNPPLRANIYSPQEITNDPKWLAPLTRAGHDVEHLEAFAFAFVAKKFRIPIAIVLGLTNVIGPKAHRDWVKNQGRMITRISDFLYTTSP